MKKIPSIHQPIQRPDGSMEYVWYLFLQWVSENVGSVDLSDYFTKEETEELLSAKANIDDLSDVAFSGNYNDLSNKPTIPDAQIQSDWNQTDNTKVDYIKNKPTIPTVNNPTITISQGGVTKGSFTLNQASGDTIDLDAGGGAGHNVGDIFFTMRPDNELNGAVECNGATYQTTDFTGAQSIGALLEAHKVAYISLSEYEWRLQNNGSVSEFGWDGTGTTAFRVPKLDTNIFIQSRTNSGDFYGIYQPGLPNIKSNVTTTVMFNNVRNQGGTNGAVTMTQTGTINLASGGGQQGLYSMYIDASQSSSIYKNNVSTVQPYAVRYRLMVQLATGTTDEALETCTGVLADVTDLKTNKSGYCSFNTNTRIAITTTNQTAAKNGWLIGSLYFSGTNVYLAINVNDIEIVHSPWATSSAWGTVSICMPIKQGQTFRYGGNGTMEQNHMYFYPDD